MNNMKPLTTGSRVLLFVTSLYVALWSIALLLHVPAVRLAFAVVLLLISVGVLLAGCAWILRRLWSMCGTVAVALARNHGVGQKGRPLTVESENEAEA